MYKFLFVFLLAASAQTVFANNFCRNFLIHTTARNSSQTIIFGCDSQNIAYKGIQIRLTTENMLDSVSVLLDSLNGPEVRAKIEENISNISEGVQSIEIQRSIRKEVMVLLRQALTAGSEDERKVLVNKAAVNLMSILSK